MKRAISRQPSALSFGREKGKRGKSEKESKTCMLADPPFLQFSDSRLPKLKAES